MDINESASLIAVEGLFEEFFNPYTSNTRKHEIETQLGAFKNAPNLCKLCLYFVLKTSSQYVTMFALQTLETVINQQWSATDWSIQEEIKSTLQLNLIYQGTKIPHFLRHKYAKLLVDIAKIDWPTKYPSFFDDILGLLKSTEHNQLIGLILLRTSCEEFIGINLTYDNYPRKKELTRLLHSYIPVVFVLLTNILEKFGTNSHHTATATPPPSPTHPTQSPNLEQQLSTATFRPDVKALSQEALDTVQFMFGWVPIEDIPTRMIMAIFRFTNVSTYSQDDDDLCVCAMSTINEIFYRKCSPPGTENFFREIYNHMIELLKNLAGSCSYRIDSYDEVFVKKLSELLVLIIEQHLWRFEKDPSFSSLEFLSLFFQYTMHLPSVPCYLRCLTVWTTFFKQIKPENAQRYSEVFLGLGNALIRKIQFIHNFTQLNEINATDVNENSQTEWNIFLDASIDIISRAAQYAPLEIFNQVLNSWEVCNSVYQQLDGAIDINNFSLNFLNSETEKLYYILRDYSTLCFTMASLAHHFYISDNEELNRTATPRIYILIDNMLQSASKSRLIRFYNLKVSEPRFTHCFIDIHSELLSSLKTWLSWMESRQKISEDIQVFLDTILPVLKDGGKVPDKISDAAARLLLEISRRSNTLNPSITEFFSLVPTLRFSERTTCDTVYSAVCEILLRHLKKQDLADFERKKTLVNIFLNGLTQEFRQLSPVCAEIKVQEMVAHVLPALSHIAEYCKGYPVVAKQEIACAIKPTLDHALILFPTYVKYTEVHNNFSRFFIAVLKNLQPQIGIEFTKNAIQIFLQVAINEQHSNNLLGLQQLIDIFCMVVKESSSKSFLPEILHLCMDNIYPLLLRQATENPDVFVSFLDLLYSILSYRWLYFYNSQVMLGYSPGGEEAEFGPDAPKRPQELLLILKVFGEGLLQEDINIFRRSLVILQDLNHNKKLYHKAIFRSHLLPELLRVLLNTLLYKRQGLWCEDIVFGIHSMAEVDFDGFFSTFLPQYIQGIEGMTQGQYEALMSNFSPTNDRDVPSFMQHLQGFANSFQHFRIVCNTSGNLC